MDGFKVTCTLFASAAEAVNFNETQPTCDSIVKIDINETQHNNVCTTEYDGLDNLVMRRHTGPAIIRRFNQMCTFKDDFKLQTAVTSVELKPRIIKWAISNKMHNYRNETVLAAEKEGAGKRRTSFRRVNDHYFFG
jgi:hypothetical protein